MWDGLLCPSNIRHRHQERDEAAAGSQNAACRFAEYWVVYENIRRALKAGNTICEGHHAPPLGTIDSNLNRLKLTVAVCGLFTAFHDLAHLQSHDAALLH